MHWQEGTFLAKFAFLSKVSLSSYLFHHLIALHFFCLWRCSVAIVDSDGRPMILWGPTPPPQKHFSKFALWNFKNQIKHTRWKEWCYLCLFVCLFLRKLFNDSPNACVLYARPWFCFTWKKDSPHRFFSLIPVKSYDKTLKFNLLSSLIFGTIDYSPFICKSIIEDNHVAQAWPSLSDNTQSCFPSSNDEKYHPRGHAMLFFQWLYGIFWRWVKLVHFFGDQKPSWNSKTFQKGWEVVLQGW